MNIFLGAFFRKKILLYIYAGLLVILMLSELGLFIAALAVKNDIRDTYDDNLWEIFNKAYTQNQTENQRGIEKLEKEFECCGVYSPSDYDSVNRTIPSSCYKEGATEPFEKGCSTAIIDWIQDELPAISGIIGAVLFLEIFGLIASIAMAVAIGHSSYGEILTNR